MIGLMSFALIFFSCRYSGEIPGEVLKEIKKAGKNARELKRVIDHYRSNPGDSLKLKAAYFLIKNLDGLVSLDTSSIASNDIYFRAFDQRIREQESKLYTFYAKKIVDSINARIGMAHPPLASYNKDIQVLTGDFLIRNIDQAFYVWENMPWAKHISFEDFCEFILPYRCSITYMDHARTFFLKKYENLPDSLKSTTNPFKVGDFIIQDINTWFTEFPDFFKSYSYLQPIKFSNLLTGKVGECFNITTLRVTALRALGVPAATDQLPNWGNNRHRHFWYKILDPENDTVLSRITNRNAPVNIDHIVPASTLTLGKVFDGIPEKVELEYVRTVPKVYRECFSRQANSLACLPGPAAIGKIPPYFLNDRLKDVTREYVDCTTINVKLNGRILGQEIAYLYVFNIDNWVPVAWGKIKNDLATFHDIGKNIVYLPVYYLNGNTIPSGRPFLLNAEGKSTELVPEQMTETVHLYMKYPYRMFVHTRQASLIGGSFRGANRPDLSDSVMLYKINKVPFYQSEAKIDNPGKYRYLYFQYDGLRNPWIAGLEFYGLDDKGNETELDGNLIGNRGTEGFYATSVKDKDRLTYFKPEKGGVPYVGYDLGEGNARRVVKASFLPRNDDNAVVNGVTYELFYWNDNWISLGFSKGQNKTVTFSNVPQNSLLLVKSVEGGTENRIFTYSKDGKQLFW